VPQPGPGEVLLKVHACGINFADTLLAAGGYQEKPVLPFTPGLEVCGTVAALGPGVAAPAAGTRVAGMLGGGGLAEFVVARADRCVPVPAEMPDEAAAALPVAYGTSHVALGWLARLRSGETLLVIGAAGGVGLTAVEIGKAMGARVIAAASTAEKLAAARSRGADDTVNYAESDLKAEVARLTGEKGVDVVFDPVGGDLFDAALSSLGWGGRILLVGFVGGIPQIPANRLLVKHRSALGSSLRYFRVHAQGKLQRSMAELLAWYGVGRLRPLISARYPLERAIEALKSLTERRAIGKVVVRMGQG
jgi:NADPH2:quinone reductase